MKDILAQIADEVEDYNSCFELHGTLVDVFCQPKGQFEYCIELDTDHWQLRYSYAWGKSEVYDIALEGNVEQAEFDLTAFYLLWENIEWINPH